VGGGFCKVGIGLGGERDVVLFFDVFLTCMFLGVVGRLYLVLLKIVNIIE
jgi:hypothetical protein